MQKIVHPEKVRWNLKRALLEKRMMVTELAVIVGTTRNYLSHVIMGRYPGWKYRTKISNALNYPEEWLFQ
ncbi:helix-turn-helix transcriptional regulator, partial [candidate division WOR-3 bacterium]|nr:helix-turn-helix transcriptional regulator [candidate division WOR-3 bacterium]